MKTPSRTLVPLLFLALLALTGMARAATGTDLARDVAVKVYNLRIEIAMMVYDENSEAYRQKARAALEAASTVIGPLLKDLAARDATAGAAAEANWQVMSNALRGGDEYGEGMISTGYDARIYAEFDDNLQQLMVALDKAYRISEGAPEERAPVLAARVVANYMWVSATPFGSYTASYNTEDSDLGKLSAKLDAALAELARKHAGDAAQAQRIKKVAAKWQFIRATIVKAGSQSTPYIVYKHGGDIIRDLSPAR